MDENKIIEIIEEPVVVPSNIVPNNIEVIEDVQEVAVQVAAPPSIEVEDENIIDIEIGEAFPYAVSGILNDAMEDKDILIDGGIANASNQETIGLQEVIEASASEGGTVNHSLLHGRELSDQHPISAISGLRAELDEIEAVKRVYSSENGLSEFRKWNDGNPNMDNRAGYFVKLVTGTENIAICTDEDDVYGITVANSGFVGNQDEFDKSDNPSYSMVGIAGALRVRTDGTARNGEYVVPNALGIATFSENDCGYKVISQGSYASYNYVTIAVTPQNDKISKIYGMLTGSAGDTVGNLIVKIEDIESVVNNNSQKVDIIITDNESIKDIIEENKNNIQHATNLSKDALAAAQEAKDGIADAVTSANEAVQQAQQAAQDAQNLANELADTMDVVDEMKVLAEFESDTYKGAAGLISIARENQMNLGSLMTTVDAQGDDIASLMLRKNEDGMSIQSLVSHIDRYSTGPYSTSYNLSKSNAQSILVNNYVYVPTVDHTESMYVDETTTEEFFFERGYSYEWDTENATWVKSQEVSLATIYKNGTQEGDLWLCWQDVEQRDENGEVVTTYMPGTLYRWFGTAWIAVASIADNAQSRMLTTLTQTADEIQSDVTNMRGDFTQLEQTVDGISTTVGTIEGNVSTIEQNVDGIQATIGNINGTLTSLQQHATDTDASITAISSGRFHVLYQSYLGAAPEVIEGGNKYSLVPIWDDEQGIFVFNEDFVDNTNGIYYFYSDDKTKYCKVVDGGYEIYTIGNQAVSALNSRITENEAELDLLVEYKEGELKNTLAVIGEKADANGASIDYVTSYYYHTLLSISETEIPVLSGERRYTNKPTWDPVAGKYVFDINDRAEDGEYYLADNQGTTYCRVVTAGDGSTLYETYGLSGSSIASIAQQVGENSASIGMFVDKDGIKADIIIEAINGESTAKINANQIQMTATDSTPLNTVIERTVKSVDTLYVASSSNTTPPDNTADWQTTAPMWQEGMYIWQKIQTIYVNGDVVDSEPTCISGADGVSPIFVEITSSAGTIYINNNINTTLIAKVYQKNQDITDEFPSRAFLWEKYDSNGNRDTTWSYAGKTVSVSNLDIWKKAMFNCIVDIELRGKT